MRPVRVPGRTLTAELSQEIWLVRPLPRTDPRTPPCLTRGRYGLVSVDKPLPPKGEAAFVRSTMLMGARPCMGGRPRPSPVGRGSSREALDRKERVRIRRDKDAGAGL